MKKITLMLFALIVTSFAWAQCGPGPDGQYPSGTITVDAAGSATTISTCNYSSEFSVVDGIVEGNDYEISIKFSSFDLYVTVENSADNSVIGFGESPYTFTAPAGVTGINLNWSENAACTYVDSGCRVTTVQDLTAAMNACADPSALAASNITDMSADLTWAENGISTVDFNVEVYLAGESAAGSNMPVFASANVVGTTVAVPGLSAATDYDAYIVAACSGATANSALVGPTSFTTTAACSDITAIMVANITSSGADISWTIGTGNDGAMVEVYVSGESAANGDTAVYSNAMAAAGSDTATGLMDNTAYDVFVTGNCGATSTMAVGPESFTTTCSAFTPDYLEDFTTFLNECWSEATGPIAGPTAYGTAGWTADGFANDGTTGSARFNIYATGGDDWLLSPTFDLTNGGYEINLDVALTAYTGTTAQTINEGDAVYVMQSIDGGITWTTVYTWDNANSPSNTGDNISIDVTAVTSATTQFAIFALEDDTSGGDMNIFIDNFQVRTQPSCVQPSDLDAMNVTTEAASLSWTDNASAASWNVELGEAGFTPTGTPTDLAVANPFEASGLTAATSYEYYVQADCGGDTSPWVGPYAFSTLCETISMFPWTEDVESTSTSLICWSSIDNNADGDAWETYDSATYANSGTQSFRIYTDYNSGSNDDYLVSPQLALTGGERLKFQQRVRSGGEPNDFTVLLSTTGAEPADFTTTILANASYNNTEYQEVVVDLTAYTGDVYIAFHVPPAGLDGWYLYIDDITVEEMPSCVEPSGLTATVTGLETVDFAWTAGDSETEWTYEYGVSPYAQGDGGTSGTVMTTPVLSLSGLVSGETYDIYVQGNCASGADSSYITASWSQPLLGATCEVAIDVAALPYNTMDDTANYGDDYTGTAGSTGCGTTSSYLNGDDVVYAYTAAADATINVAMSAIGSTYSGVFVYTDCANIGTECVAGYGNGGSTADYDMDVDVTMGTTYYIVISTWASPQSTTYTLDITENTCTEATVAYSIINDCDVSGGFNIEVDITDMGTAAGITVSDDQGSASQAVSSATTLTFGPYVNATDVVITVADDNDASCTLTSTSLTQQACPPANDNCADAMMLTAGAVFGDNPLVGTNVGATGSGELPLPGCASYDPEDTTGNGGDLWYAVTIPADGNLTIETSANPIGNGGDSGMAIYSGTCGSLVLVECDDDDSPDGAYSQVVIDDADGLAGQVVYARVWEYGGNALIDFQISAYSATLGVNTFDNEVAFTYFPNPVKNTLTLNAQNTIEQVAMYNMLGQEVLRATPNTVDSELDMSQLQTGAYFVKVTIANITQTIRVIKQ